MKKGLLAFILSLVCGIFSSTLFLFGVFESLELKMLDFRFRQFAKPEQSSKNVVLAAIDEQSLQHFKKNGIPWKWPRDFYATLVRYLNRGGAKVIVFDILFSDPDIDRANTDAEETDGAFSKAIVEAGNVILASNLMHYDYLLGGDNQLICKEDIIITPPDAKFLFPNYPAAILPIPLFQQDKTSIGAANYYVDSEDGVCRHVFPFYVFNDVVIPQIGVSAFLKTSYSKKVEIISNNLYKIGDVSIPIDNKGRFLINWYGKGGPDGCFRYYSIGALIVSAANEEINKPPIVASSEFKDKIVIIGSNAAGLFDLVNTPFSIYKPFPAMEIHATILSNLLQHDFLVRASPTISLIVILLFSFAVCFSFYFFTKVRYIVLIFTIFVIGWFLISMILFDKYNLWLDIISPEISLFVSFIIAALVSYQTEGKARRYLRSMFSRYLSPIVISEVVEKGKDIELGGEECYATAFFSDIKNFTKISETISPRELVALLNKYFSVATEIILRNEGLLDKYLGDAIMAIFGAPLSNNIHPHQACNAALEMQNALKQCYQSSDKNKTTLETRIGINTGRMIVGNIGTERRLDYTAIGDTVNVASHLEGINKIYGTNIIISESTFNKVSDSFVVRELDTLRLKGKLEPITVFELIGKREEISGNSIGWINKFHEALNLYRNRKFADALPIFKSVNELNSHDYASLEFMGRCQQYLTLPPPPDWDGVFRLDIK